MSSESLMGDQWTFLLLLKPAQGHPVPCLLLSKQVIAWPSSIISSVLITCVLQICSHSGTNSAIKLAMIRPWAAQCNPPVLTEQVAGMFMHPSIYGCALWHLLREEDLCMSYLQLYKTGVKRRLVVNDQLQQHDRTVNLLTNPQLLGSSHLKLRN